MKLYWPHARQANPKPTDPFNGRLHTYDAQNSFEECGKVFDSWENWYGWKLESMWVDVEDTETNEKETIIFERRYMPKEE